MKLAEYCEFDALGLAELVERGEVSPRELAELAAEAVSALNPQINAVIEVWADRVSGLDEDSIRPGPFRGVPFFLKDLGPKLEGRRQEAGSRLMRGHVAQYTHFFTEKLMESGLNLIGRTTCPEFGVTGTTESALTGATANPWDLQRIAGGSSGGSAAVVAAGIVPMAHANDGGGSTRIPASICGNVGLKHSRGRISYAPEGCDLSFPLFSEGVNARSVRDVAAFLDAVHGPAPGEPIMFCPPKRPFLEEARRDPGRLRVALCTDHWGRFPVHPDIAAEISRVAELCESAGHHVEITEPTLDFAQYEQAFKGIWCTDVAALLSYEAMQLGKELTVETLEPVTLKMFQRGMSVSGTERVMFTGAMHELARQLGDFFESFDVLLGPTMAQPTPRLGSPFNLQHGDQDLDDWFDHALGLLPITPINNITGTPALSLPLCTEPCGLPLGAHFMAPVGREDRLLNLAGQLERMAPWAHRRPPVHVSRAGTGR